MGEWLSAIYRVLLVAYPREFRERYGGEMRRVFRDKLRDVFAGERYSGVARYCGHVAVDLMGSAARERWAELGTISVSWVRALLLSSITASFLILWFGVGAESAALRRMVSLPAGMLAICAFAVSIATWKRTPIRMETMRKATLPGMAGTGLMLLLMLFGPLLTGHRAIETPVAIAAIAGVFGLWAAAGYSAVRDGGSVFTGLMAGAWSGMSSVLFLSTLELALWVLATWKPHPLATFWYGSGMRAAAAATQHLLEGPVIGAILGMTGGCAAIARLRPGLGWKSGVSADHLDRSR